MVGEKNFIVRWWAEGMIATTRADRPHGRWDRKKKGCEEDAVEDS